MLNKEQAKAVQYCAENGHHWYPLQVPANQQHCSCCGWPRDHVDETAGGTRKRKSPWTEKELEEIQDAREQMQALCKSLNTPPDKLVERIKKLIEDVARKTKEVEQLQYELNRRS